MKKKAKKVKKRKLIFDEEGLKAFAIKLIAVREKYEITQEELSRRSGITLSTIGRIETFKINPTLSTIFALIRGLGIPPNELFDFEL